MRTHDCETPMTLSTEWLTAAEAAAHLKINVRTVLAWTRQGKLRGYALSGMRRHVWRYRREDLDAALLPGGTPQSTDGRPQGRKR